jgi:hypothetical protein
MADTLATFTTKPIYCGDTAVLPIQCRRSDGVTPINLAGATLKATMKHSNETTVTATWQTGGSGITVTDAANGLANLVMLQTHTDKAAGNYTLDVLCIEQDGTRTTVSGTVLLVEHPSR